jgi:hypothetical protein
LQHFLFSIPNLTPKTFEFRADFLRKTDIRLRLVVSAGVIAEFRATQIMVWPSVDHVTALQSLQYFAMFVFNFLNPHPSCHPTKGTPLTP